MKARFRLVMQALFVVLFLSMPSLFGFASPFGGAVLRLESRFESEVRYGSAIMVSPQGMAITKAHVVFDLQKFGFPSAIFGQIQEDSAYPPNCFAEYAILAVDEDRDLALLEIKNPTDIYCNPVNKSDFHKSYMLKNHLDFGTQDVCPLNPGKNDKIYALFFEIRDKLTLVAKEGRVLEFIYEKDVNGSHYEAFFQTDIKMPKNVDGAPVFNVKNEFIGLLEYKKLLSNHDVGIPTVTSKALVVGWMCDLSKKGLIKTKLKKDGELLPFHKHPICDSFLNNERIFK